MIRLLSQATTIILNTYFMRNDTNFGFVSQFSSISHSDTFLFSIFSAVDVKQNQELSLLLKNVSPKAESSLNYLLNLP